MRTLIKLLCRYNSKYKSDIVVATCYSILNPIFIILAIVPLSLAINLVIHYTYSRLAIAHLAHNQTQIIGLSLTSGLFCLCSLFFKYLSNLKWENLAQNMEHEIRIDTYILLQNLPMTFFDNNSKDNLLHIFSAKIHEITLFINTVVNQGIKITTGTILIIAIFFILSTKIAIFSIIIILLVMLFVLYFAKKIKPHAITIKNRSDTLNAKLLDNLSHISMIKSFNAETFEANRLSDLSIRLLNAQKRIITQVTRASTLSLTILICGSLTILAFGSTMVLNGTLSIYEYIILLILTQIIFSPLMNLHNMIKIYKRSMAAGREIMNLINMPISIVDGNIDLGSTTKGAIIFDAVTFSYPQGKNIFTNLSFAITPGEKVAFVGSIGSGKSTLIKLLKRFYDVSTGTILVDYNNIKHLNLQSLREKIGRVCQNTIFVDGTIAENISYGDSNSTMTEIIAAAKSVEADEFIRTIPQGYNSNLKEVEKKLSHTQKIKIAMARAILRNPAILILDEINFADIETTESIHIRIFEQISKSRTTIVLNSNLKKLPIVDKIYVLQDGTIVENGTHDQLLDMQGAYANRMEA